MSKIWGFKIENCDTSEIFKNKKYPEILKENVGEFAWDRGWTGIQRLVQFSLLFCLCLTFDIYIYKEKINYILISIKNEPTLRYIH